MENSIHEKFELIDRIAEVESLGLLGQPTGLLAHSVLNSIPLNELIRVFHHEAIRGRWVSGNICRRLPDDPNREFHYDYLFEALKEATYLDRLRLRKPIDVLILALSETQQMEYFSYFFRSRYIYERKAAIKLAESIWNPDIQSIFLERYEQYKEIEILASLIRHLDVDALIDLLKTEYDVLPRYLKGIVVTRLKGTLLEKLTFILTTDPSTFVRLATFVDKKISDNVAMHCYERIPEKQRPFALYNLGLLGKWDLVRPQIEKYLEDPGNAFLGFSELLFER